MNKDENYNTEPRMFSGIGLKESFIPRIRYFVPNKEHFFRLENSPYFLKWGIERGITFQRGYTLPNKKNGKEISNEDLQRYLKFKDLKKEMDMRFIHKFIISDLFEYILSLEKMRDKDFKDVKEFFENHWIIEKEKKFKETTNIPMPKNNKKEITEKPKKKSLIQRIFN